MSFVLFISYISKYINMLMFVDIFYFISLYVFISFPYFCLSCQFSHFVILTLVWVSSLFLDFIAFNFYLLSFLLVFSSFLLFAHLCLCINQLLYIYFSVVFFVMRFNLQNINIVYICLNNYLYFIFWYLFARLFCF